MFFWLNRTFHWIRMAFQAVQNVRNRWTPELKKLSDNIDKLQESLAGTDNCVLDIYSLEETHGNRMTVLEEELTSVKACITDLKDHLNSVIKELNVITDAGIEKKLELLEEELDAVKAENVEMRNHFNSMIKELNAITAFVNEKHGHKIIEQTFEIDSPPNKGYNLRSYVVDEDSLDK